MSINLKNKYDKYWGSTYMFDLMIYVAFMLDLLHKIMSKKFWLKMYKEKEFTNKIEKSRLNSF